MLLVRVWCEIRVPLHCTFGLMGNCQDTVFKCGIHPRPGLPVDTRANSVAVPCFGVACLTRIYDAQAYVLALCTVDTKVKPLHVLIAYVHLDAKVCGVIVEKLDDFDIA